MRPQLPQFLVGRDRLIAVTSLLLLTIGTIAGVMGRPVLGVLIGLPAIPAMWFGSIRKDLTCVRCLLRVIIGLMATAVWVYLCFRLPVGSGGAASRFTAIAAYITAWTCAMSAIGAAFLSSCTHRPSVGDDKGGSIV